MLPYNEVALLCLDENIHMYTNIFQPSEVLLPDYVKRKQSVFNYNHSIILQLLRCYTIIQHVAVFYNKDEVRVNFTH